MVTLGYLGRASVVIRTQGRHRRPVRTKEWVERLGNAILLALRKEDGSMSQEV